MQQGFFERITSQKDSIHKPLSIQQITKVIKSNKNADNKIINESSIIVKNINLDGFYLLEASAVEFPDDALTAVLTGQGLKNAIEDDFPFFSQLEYLDVCENCLSLSSFGGFPKLKELRIACNNISSVDELYGFNELIVLDLSFNRLNVNPSSIQLLDCLPNLRELDLSGNALTNLSLDFSRFYYLEKLVVDNNKLDDNQIFCRLACIPKLRYLSLSSNYLWQIPPKSCNNDGYRLLDVLDLSCNYFGKEEDVFPVLDCPRLSTVLLYGNPLLGARGEDPGKIYVEDLMTAAFESREGTSKKPLDIITDRPRKKTSLKIIIGRQATYRNFRVTELEKDSRQRSNREWRKSGNQTLFAEAVSLIRRQKSYESFTGDNTFLTSFINANSDIELNAAENKANAIADDVMEKVAREMGLGLGVSTDMAGFKRAVTLPTTVAMSMDKNKSIPTSMYKNNNNALSGSNRDDEYKYGEDNGRGYEHGDDDDGQQNDIPKNLFSRNMSNAQPLAPQSIELKSALKALQFAINHPLTDYSEVPSKDHTASTSYARPNMSYHNRRINKKEFAATSTYNNNNNSSNNNATAGTASGESRLGRSGKVAVTDPSSFANRFGKTRREKQSIQQIEEILDSLNHNTEDLTSKKCGHGMNFKENVSALQLFAKPTQTIKGLIRMMDEVVD